MKATTYGVVDFKTITDKRLSIQARGIYCYLACYANKSHTAFPSRERILGELGLTNEEETDLICSAIYHHDDKLVVDSPMDEALKDADVIHHCMNDLSKAIKEKEQARYTALCQEFALKQ